MTTDPTSARPTSASQRRLKNILIRPRQQLAYAVVFFGLALTVICGYVVFLFDYVRSILSGLPLTYTAQPEIMISLLQTLKTASVSTVVLAFFLFLIIVAAGLKLSHRIFGPVVSITRLIDDLRAGDYAARGHLRKKDEFQELMTSLNELAESLEKRHGKGS